MEEMVQIPTRLLGILASKHADYAAQFCMHEYPEFEGMDQEDITYEDVLAALRELCALRKHNLEIQRAAWEAQWPNHCKTCGGTGCAIVSVQDDDPKATMCDVCEECGMRDPRCPRCGHRFGGGHFEEDVYVAGEWDEWMESAKPCPVCGFIHGKGD